MHLLTTRQNASLETLGLILQQQAAHISLCCSCSCHDNHLKSSTTDQSFSTASLAATQPATCTMKCADTGTRKVQQFKYNSKHFAKFQKVGLITFLGAGKILLWILGTFNASEVKLNLRNATHTNKQLSEVTVPANALRHILPRLGDIMILSRGRSTTV